MGREDSWRAELLDREERVKTVLGRVRGGSLSWSVSRSVHGSGTLDVSMPDDLDIDWLNDRIRITHVDGDQVTPMGVWLPTVPSRDTAGPVTRATIALSDKTELLNSPCGYWYGRNRGAGVVAHVTAIIRARGITSIALTPSGAELTTALLWKPTDTWLTIVNDMLRAIGYDTLSADMRGVLQAGPYLTPDQRPISGAYGPATGDRPMRPAWQQEANLSEIPTGARFVVEGTDSQPGLIGRADHPAGHPFSAASRGGVEVLRVETGEAVDQAAATVQARRLLDESAQVTFRATVVHPVDETRLGDVVHHRPAAVDAAIVERTVGLGVGAVVTDTLRHIYTGGQMPWIR